MDKKSEKWAEGDQETVTEPGDIVVLNLGCADFPQQEDLVMWMDIELAEAMCVLPRQCPLDDQTSGITLCLGLMAKHRDLKSVPSESLPACYPLYELHNYLVHSKIP